MDNGETEGILCLYTLWMDIRLRITNGANPPYFPPMATKWPFMTAGAGEGPGDGNLWVGRGTRQKPMSQ